MKKIFIKSKWIHKFFGLFLLLFLSWMSISGIFLNHPHLISNISLPNWLIPSHYDIVNWNRSALTTVVFSKSDPDLAFAAGKLGIWKSEDGGKSFRKFENGLPQSKYYVKTNHLFLLEEQKKLLFAATDGGFYVNELSVNNWRKIGLGNPAEKARKILYHRNQIILFTESNVYRYSEPFTGESAERIVLKQSAGSNSLTLVRLFFDIHDGKAWKLPGQLVYDFTGVVLLFLSFSAFYIWYFPWKRKRQIRSVPNGMFKIKQKIFKYSFKYHLKLGIWFAFILFIMGATGFFMRPPLLAVIANKEIPVSYYPGFFPDNPWDKKIQNALYDSAEDEIIIQTTNGFWKGNSNFQEEFIRFNLEAPVFVMGTTVFQNYDQNSFLIGSFNGIYQFHSNSNTSIDLLTNRTAKDVSSVQPAEFMVTGYFKTPAGEEFINTHEQGLMPIGGADFKGRFEMPDSIRTQYQMSLWNYMFEIHNGRIFKNLIGGFYILLVPLGALLFLFILLSGIFDWIYLKKLRYTNAD